MTRERDNAVTRLFVFLAAVVLVVASPAGAANSKAAAKHVADGYIEDYLRAADVHPGLCTARSSRGYIDKGAGYLSACRSKDGKLEVFAFASARKGNVSIKSPYFYDRLRKVFCRSGGDAFSTGVRGQYVLFFAGRGAAAVSSADEAANAFAYRIQNTPGYVEVTESC